MPPRNWGHFVFISAVWLYVIKSLNQSSYLLHSVWNTCCHLASIMVLNCCISIGLPSSCCSEVTPILARPQLTILLNQFKSVFTFTAKPCIVIWRLTLAPTALIFLAFGVPALSKHPRRLLCARPQYRIRLWFVLLALLNYIRIGLRLYLMYQGLV